MAGDIVAWAFFIAAAAVMIAAAHGRRKRREEYHRMLIREFEEEKETESEANMSAAVPFFSALNAFFLDVAPFAALAVIAVQWFLSRRNYRSEERELLERIDFYRRQYRSQESGLKGNEGFE